ncbi:hypothetical protein KGM48_03765 [Patescibacteria group bacterium]|nr:hypothetical protein [Patescibacteria group bacterium]
MTPVSDGKRSPRKEEGRAAEIVAREAARFIAREAGPGSLITVIRAQSVAHGDRILVFVSVYPADKAPAALAFLERQREAFSNHLKKHTHMRLPHIDFMLENGEGLGGPGGN